MSAGAAPVQRVETDDGLCLAYHAFGTGPRVVIAPAASWLAADLTPLGAEDRTLVFYDVRSQGRSDRAPDDRIGFERDVADLECLRRALGAERVRLLGWSYYGAVAARYAHAFRDRVERMVLVAPAAPRAEPHWRGYLDNFAQRLDPRALAELERMRRAGARERDPVAWCRAHTALILGVYVADPSCLARMRSTPCVRPNLDPEAVNQQTLKVITAMGDYDWRDEMRDLRVPTLILHGDRDPVPLPGTVEWTEVLPDVRLDVLEGIGHLPWLERPEAFFPPVDAFLAG